VNRKQPIPMAARHETMKARPSNGWRRRARRLLLSFVLAAGVVGATAMPATDIVRFISVVASGLAAGVLIAFLVGMVPAVRRLPEAQALKVKQIVDPLIDRFNPPAVVLATVSGILLLVAADGLSSTSTVFDIGGIVGSVGVGATSLGVNMPINRRMKEWSPEAPPPEFWSVMKRWGRAHKIRTFLGVTGFACYVVAALTALG
jgi:uncharacterized membrane protein